VVHLRMMDTLKEAFGLPIGFSDHTLGVAVAVAAVARGAAVIEKHFTLNRRLEGPDHSYALEPAELKAMVKAIRDVEKSMGSGYKKMLTEERQYARRTSLIAKADIPKGAELNRGMIVVSRPALGIEPRLLDAVVSGRAKRRIKKGEPIRWDLVG